MKSVLLLATSLFVSGILDKRIAQVGYCLQPLGQFLLDIQRLYQIYMAFPPFRITSNSVSLGISLKALRGF